MTSDTSPRPPDDGTESLDAVLMEFTATIDSWEPVPPEQAAEMRRRLRPPFGPSSSSPTDPKPPTE